MKNGILLAAFSMFFISGCHDCCDRCDPCVKSAVQVTDGSTRSWQTPKGYKFRVRPVNYADPRDEDADPTVAAPHVTDGEHFNGTDRAIPKTTIAPGAVEPVNSLSAFVATLPADTVMSHHNPVLKKTTSVRMEEEKRNVKVRAFMLASKKEDDNDFHVILTNNPDSPSLFFTAEISGIPSNDNATLVNARNQFKTIVAGQHPIGRKYQFFDPPIPVVIAGSLFFDIDHPVPPNGAGVVGPEGSRPNTAWEIHPVSDIEEQ